MKDDQYNKALHLLMGRTWDETLPKTIPETCATASYIARNPDHLANPLPVIRWMEREMPDTWKSYLCSIPLHVILEPVEWVNYVLDLRNLIEFLWQNQDWGEKECPECEGKGGTKVLGFTVVCPTCHGTGRVTHPCLEYLKEVHNEGN